MAERQCQEVRYKKHAYRAAHASDLKTVLRSQVFKVAKALAPSVIYIDEVEKVHACLVERMRYLPASLQSVITHLRAAWACLCFRQSRMRWAKLLAQPACNRITEQELSGVHHGQEEGAQLWRRGALQPYPQGAHQGGALPCGMSGWRLRQCMLVPGAATAVTDTSGPASQKAEAGKAADVVAAYTY